jgi:2-oxoglutarate dehydrogenase E1 component
VHDRLAGMLRDGQKLHYAGHPAAAAPATGSHHRHEDQQKALVAQAINGQISKG